MSLNVTVETPTAIVVPVPQRRLGMRSLPPSLLAGMSILVVWTLITLLVPPLVGRSPTETSLTTRLEPPSSGFLFGTDALGRDILVRTAVAFRYDLLIAVVSVVTAAIVGSLLGALAGSSREGLDNLVMRSLDVIAAFPSFMLALMLASALGASVITVILAIAVVLVPQYAQGARAAIMVERSKPYAEAARAMALPGWRIVLVHLLPNSLGPTLTAMAMDMATAIMVAAGLSFIGFGVQPPTPEWGLMINEGASYIISGEWWVTFFPGLAILSLVIGFILIDDGIKRMRRI